MPGLQCLIALPKVTFPKREVCAAQITEGTPERVADWSSWQYIDAKNVKVRRLCFFEI